MDTEKAEAAPRGDAVAASKSDRLGSEVGSEFSVVKQQVQRGGRRSRQKGNRAERAVVKYLQDRGFAAERVPLSGSAGGGYLGDVKLALLGRDLVVEVKVRAAGFTQLYSWLESRDLLIVRRDRAEPLVVLPLSLAAEFGALTANYRGAK